MQRTFMLKQDLLRTTPEVNNKLQIKENSHLFNRPDKLALDHDVFVSSTMIKVTYKKALKDQNASENSVKSRRDGVYNKSISQISKKKTNKHFETMNLCKNDISFISKSPKIHADGSKAFVYHSTPKPQSLAIDRKNKFVNGLHLSAKSNKIDEKSSPPKVHKKFSPHQDGGSNLKKSKTTPVKSASLVEVSKTFLKSNNSIVKPKASIIKKNITESKKVTLKKTASKKIIKLDNNFKNKSEAGKKSLKRKASSADFNNLAKKIKLSESKTKEAEGDGKGQESKHKGSKRQIMLVDPDLPTGWTRCIRTKNKGSANEQSVVYVVNPQGKQFRFKWKLRKYLEKTNSSLDVDRFFFGLYERPKASSVSAGDRDDQSKSDISEGTSREGFENQKYSKMRDSRQEETSNTNSGKSSEGKELLLYDPDLPFGWKRVIHSNSSNGKKQVHIISPDGKIFRRRYRLNEYLKKHQYGHDLDRFYFGLYRKKDGVGSETSGRESEEKTSAANQSNNCSTNMSISKKGDGGKEKLKMIANENGERLLGKRHLRLILKKIDESGACKQGDFVKRGIESAPVSETNNGSDCLEFRDESPMYDDPNLPEGWKRLIRIRSCGESAGRMEVIIVSPDGRKHRSRKPLQRYLSQMKLGYKAEDFDFHVFGKSNLKKHSESARELEPEQKPENKNLHSEPNDFSFQISQKKLDKPVPELDIDSLKEVEISPEGHLINEVNGLMVSVGLSSARNERRQRLPGGEQEKQLKTFLSSKEDTTSMDGCEIPTMWIQTLMKCRGNFRPLEPDAASAVGKAVREFLQKLTFLAFSESEEPDRGLRYEDVAGIVHRLDSLSPLQILIPKKITYKEYTKLNRPKQFWSFT